MPVTSCPKTANPFGKWASFHACLNMGKFHGMLCQAIGGAINPFDQIVEAGFPEGVVNLLPGYGPTSLLETASAF